jgi:hypothetical protein
MDRQGRPGSRAPADTGRRNSALQRVDTLHHPSLSSAHTQSPIHHGFNFWRVRALSIRHEAIHELARQCSHCLARPGNTHGSRHGPNRLIFIKRRLHPVPMMQIGWQICTFVSDLMVRTKFTINHLDRAAGCIPCFAPSVPRGSYM